MRHPSTFATATNNISDLGDAPGTSTKSCNATFVDADAGDFHLASTDDCAIDVAADLSSDADLPILSDLDGEVRSAPWDVGADEQ